MYVHNLQNKCILLLNVLFEIYSVSVISSSF